MGTECHYFICDVGNREEVYQTAKAVREKVSSLEGSVLSSAGPRRIAAKELNLTWPGKSLANGRMAVSGASLGTLPGSWPVPCVRECARACVCYSGWGLGVWVDCVTPVVPFGSLGLVSFCPRACGANVPWPSGKIPVLTPAFCLH